MHSKLMVKRSTAVLATAVLWLMAAMPALAATIHPEDETPLGATTIANTIAATPGIVLGATYVTAPPNNAPNGWEDAPLTQFPTHGTTFGILTSGEVTNVDDPGTFTSVSDGGAPFKGDSARDVSILQILLDAPQNSNCLTFDFKFLSEEFPVFVGSSFNDAFIAELDLNTWTAVGSTITAPDNFAFDASGDVVSVNSTGIGGMTAAQGSGTAYDGGPTHGGATVLLQASTQITPGLHSVYFSIFDQGDNSYDSAVFLDNLRIGFVPNPEVNCQPGAQPVNFQMTLDPAEDTNPVGTPHTVTATLTDENGDPVAGATIEFDVTGANTTAGADVTDANGQAEFTYTGTNTGDDTITACYNADASADGSCEAFASAMKTWVLPASTEGCKVTYGGRITAANLDEATFGGNAQADGLKGQEEYQDHGPAVDMNVHSIDVLAVTCSTDGTSASIFGTATIDGAGSFNYQIDVTDPAAPDSPDTYRIRVGNAYDSGEQPLAGGNVQIH